MSKKVLVTGVSSGVGQATAELLHSKGYAVYGISSRGMPENCSVPFSWTAMELSDASARQQAMAEFPLPIDELDILVLNAGVGELGSVEETPIGQSRHLFEVNYWANLDLIQKVLPAWRRRGYGQIIVLGSIVTELHFPFKAQYSASKSALTAMLDSLRFEVEDFGIRINVLEPGWIRSQFHDRLRPVQVEKSAYAHRYGRFLDFKNDHNPKYPDGKAVALEILKCIEASRPFRFAVGLDARSFYAFGRCLPYKVREWLIRTLSS